ncbi:transposase, partial [Myxococcota bacterium]|nr:transposase [Myxococcota bacterium]
HPFSDYQTGAITFVQRFGSSLNMNLHFHTLFLDGVYQKPQGDAQNPPFIMASKPKDEEIKKLSEQISSAIIKMLDDKGVLERFKDQDPLLQYNLPLAL